MLHRWGPMLLLVAVLMHGFDANAVSTLDSLELKLEEEIGDSSRLAILATLVQQFEFKDRDKCRGYIDDMIALSKNIGSAEGKVKAYNFYGYLADDVGAYEEALENYDKALSHTEGTDLLKLRAHTFNNRGVVYRNQGKYLKANEAYQKGLDVFEQLQDSTGIALVNGNMGIVYQDRGMYPKALEHELIALQIDEALYNDLSIARHLGNIGIVYKQSGDLEKALEYYLKSDSMNKSLDSKVPGASTLANIGLVYYELGDTAKALEYYEEALILAEKIEYNMLIANTLGNLGNIYTEMKLFDKAMDHLNRSLNMSKDLGDQRGIATKLGNIGSLYTKQEDYTTAIEYMEKAKQLASEISAQDLKKEWCRHLSTLYEKVGKFDKAYEMYKTYAAIKDSLFNEEKSKDIGKLEAKYEFEKAEQERILAERKAATIEEEQGRRRDNLQYSVIIMVIAGLFIALLLLGRINISVRLAEGMIFFTFLLLFEFTLVLLDPYIEEYSSGAPAIKLGFNAVLAALIFPLHAFFEEKVKKQIV